MKTPRILADHDLLHNPLYDFRNRYRQHPITAPAIRSLVPIGQVRNSGNGFSPVPHSFVFLSDGGAAVEQAELHIGFNGRRPEIGGGGELAQIGDAAEKLQAIDPIH